MKSQWNYLEIADVNKSFTNDTCLSLEKVCLCIDTFDIKIRQKERENNHLNSVLPYVEIISSLISPTVAQKQSTEVLNWKVQFFQIDPKVTKYLGYFLKKIYSQYL